MNVRGNGKTSAPTTYLRGMANLHSPSRRIVRGWVACTGMLLVTTLAGCASSPPALVEKIPFLPQKEPDRMVVVLSPSRMEELGQGSRQGMLCRVYFFHGEDPVPVRAKGDLVFTAYDQSKGGKNREPDGKYEIKAEELASHLRKDIVGDSYLFWLPYEPTAKTQMSLQGRFNPPGREEFSSGVIAMEMVPSNVANIAQSKPTTAPQPVTAVLTSKDEKTLLKR
ncbi:MAG: hypothetical protein U1D30_01940 [Planctomycetota bacterium]